MVVTSVLYVQLIQFMVEAYDAYIAGWVQRFLGNGGVMVPDLNPSMPLMKSALC